MSPHINIIETLGFVDNIKHVSLQQTKQVIDFAIDITNDVKTCLKQHQNLLPFHLNVIDELHINENGHSRILCKLLQYKTPNGKYPILNSLLKYIISQQCLSFEKIEIVNPEITQEKSRIDLWVRDKEGGYAIIFENKVYNATDQDAQIARYIDCTKTYGFVEEQIFVIYLSQQGVDPEKQSWGNYKSRFEIRYVNLSFNQDILIWLKKFVAPAIPPKDFLLRCAIEQYIDYLEGLFNLRAINNTLNMKVKDIIKEKMGLNEDCEQNLTSLIEKIKEINEVRSYLDNMRIENEQKCWLIWYNRLIERYGKHLEIVYRTTSKYPQVGVIIPILEKRVYVIIERDLNIYYGIRADMQGDNTVDEQISKLLASVFIQFEGKQEGSWYQWKYVDSTHAYEQLCNLIDEILNVVR